MDLLDVMAVQGETGAMADAFGRMRLSPPYSYEFHQLFRSPRCCSEKNLLLSEPNVASRSRDTLITILALTLPFRPAKHHDATPFDHGAASCASPVILSRGSDEIPVTCLATQQR